MDKKYGAVDVVGYRPSVERAWSGMERAWSTEGAFTALTLAPDGCQLLPPRLPIEAPGDGGNRCSRRCVFDTILAPNRRQLPPPWLPIKAQGGCWELEPRGVPFLFLFWRPTSANGCHPGCRSRHRGMAGIGAPKGAVFCHYSGA